MSLFIPQARTLGDTWLPSEVRRRLVEARAGTMSPLLRESDGTDERSASAFAVKGHQFETLIGDEAIAGLDLLAALHAGTLDSFAVVDDQTSRLSPRYWEQQHEAALVCVGGARRAAYVHLASAPLEDGYTDEDQAAWLLQSQKEREYADYCFQVALKVEEDIQRSALLWGEDTISNHPDRPIPVLFLGAHVLVERRSAQTWIGDQIRRAGAALASSADRKARRRATPNELDKWAKDRAAEGWKDKDVTAQTIKETWQGAAETRPTILDAKGVLKAARGGNIPVGRPIKSKEKVNDE